MSQRARAAKKDRSDGAAGAAARRQYSASNPGCAVSAASLAGMIHVLLPDAPIDAAALLDIGERNTIIAAVASRIDEVRPDIRAVWRQLLHRAE